jgi:signal transduction histidine kinase
MLLIGLAMLWRLARASLQMANEEARLLLLAAVLVFAVGLRDYLVDLNGGYRNSWDNLLPYTVGAVLATHGLFLLKRVTGALTEAELLNRELEDRVAEKAREIGASHTRVLQLERQQAAQEERERITRDMHDGIGGHLIQALSIAEANPDHGPMELVLRNALTDLRMMIDSAEQVDGDISAVLAMMRGRCERRIHQAGLRFDWQVADLPLLPNLEPHHVLQIMRILDESLTNVILHANATVVTVRATRQVDPGDPTGVTGVLVQVEDNGTGLSAGRATRTDGRSNGSPGRGLNNMKQRAHSIGARLSVDSGAGGTCVQLLIALPANAGAVTEAG